VGTLNANKGKERSSKSKLLKSRRSGPRLLTHPTVLASALRNSRILLSFRAESARQLEKGAEVVTKRECVRDWHAGSPLTAQPSFMCHALDGGGIDEAQLVPW
jgi:hypothetical protein